jgi:hypothetical protein
MHICTINNKRYIGATKQKSIKDRWKNGKGYIFNEELNNDIKKYGVNAFTHIELSKKLCTISEAKNIEEYYIKKLKPEYNKITRGIKIISPNATKSMQIKMKNNPEWCKQKVKDCLNWQKENPEKMKQIRQQNIKKATESRKHSVICITNGKTYNSIADAVKDTGCSQSKISSCCLGNIKSTKGLVFKYVEDYSTGSKGRENFIERNGNYENTSNKTESN